MCFSFFKSYYCLTLCIFSYTKSDSPEIESKPATIVNVSKRIVLERKIDSNPLSNISWYNGTKFLKDQSSVKTATFIIESTSCTDTNNFTLIASNNIQENATAIVELIVNCKLFLCHFLMILTKIIHIKNCQEEGVGVSPVNQLWQIFALSNSLKMHWKGYSMHFWEKPFHTDLYIWFVTQVTVNPCRRNGCKSWNWLKSLAFLI